MGAAEERRGPSLTCVTKRMAHHGQHAGYAALIPHLRPDRLVAVPGDGVSRWLGALTRRLALGHPPGSDWWGAPSALAELRAWLGARGRHVVHLMYGEDLLGLSSYSRRPDVRVVATFHQPMARVEALHVPRGAVARLDALICLDEAAAEAWRARHPRLPVHALRLGVDTDFWSPPEAPERKRSCLVVGSHLRDPEALRAALEGLLARGVQVDLVGVSDKLAEVLPTGPGVRRHSHIDDEALRALYRQAGVFLLCLKAASGNNALLQAMATGCPVVATDLAGVRSYVGGEAARLVAVGDGVAAGEAALEVLEGAELAGAMAEAGRERAMGYSLGVLAGRHWEVYRGLY